MKKTVFRAVTAVVLILHMTFIFSLSSQVAEDSQKLSGGFTQKVFSVFYPGFSEMTEEQQQQIIEGITFPIRKLAHFSIYFLLGVFSFLAVISYDKIAFWLRCVISFLICFVYAASDEIHQLYVPGRSGEFRDVLIDSSGALLAVSAMALIAFLRYKKRIGAKG